MHRYQAAVSFTQNKSISSGQSDFLGDKFRSYQEYPRDLYRKEQDNVSTTFFTNHFAILTT